MVDDAEADDRGVDDRGIDGRGPRPARRGAPQRAARCRRPGTSRSPGASGPGPHRRAGGSRLTGRRGPPVLPRPVGPSRAVGDHPRDTALAFDLPVGTRRHIARSDREHRRRPSRHPKRRVARVRGGGVPRHPSRRSRRPGARQLLRDRSRAPRLDRRRDQDHVDSRRVGDGGDPAAGVAPGAQPRRGTSGVQRVPPAVHPRRPLHLRRSAGRGGTHHGAEPSHDHRGRCRCLEIAGPALLGDTVVRSGPGGPPHHPEPRRAGDEGSVLPRRCRGRGRAGSCRHPRPPVRAHRRTGRVRRGNRPVGHRHHRSGPVRTRSSAVRSPVSSESAPAWRNCSNSPTTSAGRRRSPRSPRPSFGSRLPS